VSRAGALRAEAGLGSRGAVVGGLAVMVDAVVAAGIGVDEGVAQPGHLVQ